MEKDLNLALAYQAVELLCRAGVREFVLCSGSRCVPLLAAISQAETVRCFNYFSERAGAFFALGRIKQSRNPVAIVTTSGTAVAELYPACIEAYYSGLPLVLVTADRPKTFRGTGAPQAIEQFPFFGKHLAAEFDLDHLEQLPDDLKILDRGPVHLNLCFDEPLLSVNPTPWKPQVRGGSSRSVVKSESPVLLDFIAQHRSPIVLLGRIPAPEQKPVTQFLLELKAPIYAESLSMLREEPKLSHLILRSGDSLLKALDFDSVIRIGSIPTTSFWRDLERDSKFSRIPVLSLSPEKFTGLARGSTLLNLNTTALPAVQFKHPKTDMIVERDRSRAEKLSHLLLKFPRAEASLMATLSSIIKNDAFVYLGNSLPIREWDLAAEFSPNRRRIEANRGANGIDGQLSTFFGAIGEESDAWCVLGDLTTMYEMEAPAILPQLGFKGSIRLVVINNHGGRIFERLPEFRNFLRGTSGAAAMIQPHSFCFESWASLWGFEYLSLKECSNLRLVADKLPRNIVLELNPDADESEMFWEGYKSL